MLTSMQVQVKKQSRNNKDSLRFAQITIVHGPLTSNRHPMNFTGPRSGTIMSSLICPNSNKFAALIFSNELSRIADFREEHFRIGESRLRNAARCRVKSGDRVCLASEKTGARVAAKLATVSRESMRFRGLANIGVK
jgi:hypothetical protein